MEQASGFASAVLDADQIPVSRQRAADARFLASSARAAPAVVVRKAIHHGHHSPAGSGNERGAVGGAMRAAWTSFRVASHEAWVDADEVEREGGSVVVTERAVRALVHEPDLL